MRTRGCRVAKVIASCSSIVRESAVASIAASIQSIMDDPRFAHVKPVVTGIGSFTEVQPAPNRVHAEVQVVPGAPVATRELPSTSKYGRYDFTYSLE